MDATTVTTFATNFKGQDAIATLVDGTEVIGSLISVNSKGLNLNVDGKVRSISINRLAGLVLEGDVEGDELDDNDELSDEDIYAELGDGMTTAELAAHLSDALKLDMTPKELRVHLRALGLGVGKGRKYSLSATEYRMVRDLVKASA